MTEPLLEIHNLRTFFHTPEGTARAVDGVDLTIHAGRTLCIVGESGCGKSVTALSILRLIGAAAEIMPGSHIYFEGRDLAKATEKELRAIRGHEIGMIFQEPMTSLDPVHTIGFQIAEAIRAHDVISRRAALDKAVELMRIVGISSPERRVNSYPHELSGGMRQRVMIASALCCSPKLLIADEPTTALDVTIQAQILELLQRLREQVNMSVLLISHDMGVVATMADEIAVMYAGKVVESGLARDVLRRPMHPYTEALLQSIPALGMNKGEQLRVIPGSVPSPFHWPRGCRFADRCTYAFDRCRSYPPVFQAQQHKAACWLRSEELQEQLGLGSPDH